jgi:hypothetical protein
MQLRKYTSAKLRNAYVLPSGITRVNHRGSHPRGGPLSIANLFRFWDALAEGRYRRKAGRINGLHRFAPLTPLTFWLIEDPFCRPKDRNWLTAAGLRRVITTSEIRSLGDSDLVSTQLHWPIAIRPKNRAGKMPRSTNFAENRQCGVKCRRRCHLRPANAAMNRP